MNCPNLNCKNIIGYPLMWFQPDKRLTKVLSNIKKGYLKGYKEDIERIYWTVYIVEYMRGTIAE